MISLCILILYFNMYHLLGATFENTFLLLFYGKKAIILHGYYYFKSVVVYKIYFNQTPITIFSAL